VESRKKMESRNGVVEHRYRRSIVEGRQGRNRLAWQLKRKASLEAGGLNSLKKVGAVPYAP
jgi:hypothetical protein